MEVSQRMETSLRYHLSVLRLIEEMVFGPNSSWVVEIDGKTFPASFDVSEGDDGVVVSAVIDSEVEGPVCLRQVNVDGSDGVSLVHRNRWAGRHPSKLRWAFSFGSRYPQAA